MLERFALGALAAVLCSAAWSASAASTGTSDSVRITPLNQIEQLQLAQQGDPFGAFMQGLFGMPSGNQGNQGGSPYDTGPKQAPMQPVTGDPMAHALRQIDMGKEIQAKALALEASLARVIYTVKLYQALNGGIWYRLGLQLNEVHKLDNAADAQWVRQFISATGQKRASAESALKFVEVNAIEDLQGQNHTIANNNAKIAMLRKSVVAYVNAAAGPNSFDRLCAQQNVPLDAMMNAYLTRIEEITATLEGAAQVFGAMSRAYEEAVLDMDQAIMHFEAQGNLVAAETTKHIAILALEVARLTQYIDSAKDNPFGAILVIAQGMNILSELSTMQDTLGAFNETKDWFDAHSQDILAASRGARAELDSSVRTIQALRPMLAESWQRHIQAASQAAAGMRQQSVAFENELAKMRKKGKARAKSVQQADMAELDALLKMPASLKSS